MKFYVTIRLFPINRRGSFQSQVIEFNDSQSHTVSMLKKIISEKYGDYKKDSMKISRITQFLNDDETLELGETLNVIS